MVKISAIIITFNEEKNIARCIDSIKPVADEIVVIDSYSIDRTCDISIERGARVVKHPFKTHIDQKNFAITQATYEVVLSLDADEYLSEELTNSILEVKESWPFDAYRMNRLSNYGGKWIKHGNWYPDQKIRLWKKYLGLWGGENPHDKVILKKGVKVMHLKGDLLHRAYVDSNETLSKIQNYSEIFARENVGRKSANVFTILVHTFFAFFKSYVLKRGFLDGYEGLVVGMAVANHVFYKYAKLYEANHKSAIGRRIVISRTDNLGDVILTLPLAGYLKSTIPNVKITFIGKKYTQSVISQSVFVDHFLDKDEVLADPHLLELVRADTIIFVYPDHQLAKLAKKLKIKGRVATAHRLRNWLYCNHLVDFSRYRSNLHESQLNFKLLKPFKLNVDISTNELIPFYGIEPTHYDFSELLSNGKFNLIIHPKSKGHGKEWGLENYFKLIKKLPAEKFAIYITGLKEEEQIIKESYPEFFSATSVTNLMGRFSMSELISFINQADGLLASGTGVLHLASALGKYSLGLFPPIKPIHPGRWGPIGNNASYIVRESDCFRCKGGTPCECMSAITVDQVKQKIDGFYIKKFKDHLPMASVIEN
jgi:ADP-heptose:LPS heptosyltransferase